MDKRRPFHEHQEHSRPDRSRSPLRNSHPYEKNSCKTKSVLYSSEVQFHRSPKKFTQQHRSPSKPSCSKTHPNCNLPKPSKAPLKEQSQANRTQSGPPQLDPDAGIRKLVEKLQKWNKMHSPPKFMAGMMSGGEAHEIIPEATPKRRSQGPWFIQYFIKEDGRQQQSSSKKSPKENIIRIEKENRRTDDFLANHSNAEMSSFPAHAAYKRVDAPGNSVANAVETDEDGYAIPSVLKQGGQATLGREFEPASFMTPSKTEADSPYEAFFTPLTHPRPKECINSEKAGTTKEKLHWEPSSTPQKPQFSLINVNRTPSSSFLQHDTTLKEKTEMQLAEYERVSSKLDKALEEANEVLNRPIKLGLPSSGFCPNFPPFSEERQTMDPAQMENLRNGNAARRPSPRQSLPSHGILDRDNSTLNRTFVISANKEDSHGAYAVSPAREKKSNVQLPRSDISLSKALGASMAAELAYAERAQRIQTHLHAAHRLASAVDHQVDRFRDQSHDGDDIDRVLDSISLRDESLISSSIREPRRKSPPKMQPKIVPSPPKMYAFTSAERQIRKEKVEEYLRMCHRLRALQHLLYHRKRRLTSNSRQLVKIDELTKAVDTEYNEAVIKAKSWLSRKISQREFLLLVERHEKEIYIETEQCCNTIKHLRSTQLQLTKGSTSSGTHTQSPPVVTVLGGSEVSPVRVDTRALNESVECDVFDLSARSLRRSLEARREQAEMLNRSFEEKTREIEQKTKQSIAAQIIQYDRAIAERTTLLHRLDEIESSPEPDPVLQQTPTPRRAGVEPLDLSQLSSKEDDFTDETKEVGVKVATQSVEENTFDQDHTDVGISRAYSYSTIYEDSLSHFDEDEDKRPSSVSSEATLYQSDLEDEQREGMGKEPADMIRSRRTLDTAETLTLLSRQMVTVICDERVEDESDRVLKKIVEEATQKHAYEITPEKLTQSRLSLGDVADSRQNSLPVQLPKQRTSLLDAFEHEELLEGAARGAHFVTTPYESARVEVSMTKTGVIKEHTEQQVMDKTATRSIEVISPVTLKAAQYGEPEESEKSVNCLSLFSAESSLVNLQLEKEKHQISRSSAASLPESTDLPEPPMTIVETKDAVNLMDIDQSDVADEATTDMELSEEFLDEQKTQSSDLDSLGDVAEKEPQLKQNLETEDAEKGLFINNAVDQGLSEDDLFSCTADSDGKQEINVSVAANAKNDAESSIESCEAAANTVVAEPAVGGSKDVENVSGVVTEVHEETVREIGNDAGDVSSTTIFEDLSDEEQKDEEKQPVELAAPLLPAPEENSKSYERRATEPYELSFLERTIDRTMEGRASLGLNRSELCDGLSASILQCMVDSPRRRSLPRAYNLDDSLLKDSLTCTPKSPRAPKERFNTKMPMHFSPHSQSWLEDADTKIADALVNDALSSMRLSELDREVEEITARVERRSMTSPTEYTGDVQNTITAVAEQSKDLIQPLDETYEDLLSIEKPTSQLNHATTSLNAVPETKITSHAADTPRKVLPQQSSSPSTEEIKQKRKQELSEQLHSEEWMKKKCVQFLTTIWNKVQLHGYVRPLVDEFIPAPKVVDEIMPQDDDEELLLENRTFLIWDAMIEVAAKLWPESPEVRRSLGSKLLPVPRTREEFANKAIDYVLEKLNEMPPSHCYNRVSRPPAPPFVDTTVDRAVGRRFYEEDPHSFARKVYHEYQKLCEEIIDRVGDRFVITEVQQLQQSFAAGNSDANLSNMSAIASGEFGRPSLARLSLSSGKSVGRCSVTAVSPLRVVPEMSEL